MPTSIKLIRLLDKPIVRLKVGLKRFPPDLNRRDSQGVKDRRICVH